MLRHPAPLMRPGPRTAILCALLFAGTLLLFSRALRCDFVNFDDPGYVTANPVVQGGLSRAGILWAFTARADYWHPLAWLSHMLDCQLYGLSPAGHHLSSVLWHALNAVLAYLLFQSLVGGPWRSAFAAALFAWHPLRVESVVWISERKDVMSGCFFLLTLLAYADFARSHAAGRPSRRSYLLALGLFAAGLMSKPMLVTLPLILLVLDAWPLPHRPLRRLLLEKLPFFALSAAAAAATLVMQGKEGAFVLRLPLGARFANAAVSLVRYLGKALWPFDLAVCYPHPGSWPAAAVLGSAALLLALAGAAWWQLRDRPWIAAGLGIFLIALLPVLGLIQVGFQAMADRYTYLPLLGVELVLLPFLPSPPTRGLRFAAGSAAACLLAALALRTWNQEGVWKSSETLFAHAVRVDGRNPVAEDFLASALFAEGRLAEAGVHAERARRLDPRADGPLVTLAGISQRQGRAEEAIGYLQTALTLRPDNPPVRCQLGLLELGRGRLDLARELMAPALAGSASLRRRTLQLAFGGASPAAAFFLYDLVFAAAPAEAAAAAEGSPVFLSRAADDYARARDVDDAIALYRRVLALSPSDARAHAALGYLLIYRGEREGGAAEWRRALELDPAFPGLREQLRRLQE